MADIRFFQKKAPDADGSVLHLCRAEIGFDLPISHLRPILAGIIKMILSCQIIRTLVLSYIKWADAQMYDSPFSI